MNAQTWISLAALVVTVLSLIGGAIYMRGQLDAQQEEIKHTIDNLISKVNSLDGTSLKLLQDNSAQAVINRSLEPLAKDIRECRDLAVVASSKIEAHQRDCERRATDTGRRMEQMERTLESLRSEFSGMATGRADRFKAVQT